MRGVLKVNEEKKRKNRTVLIIVLVVAGLITLCCIISVITGYFGQKTGIFEEKKVEKEKEDITKEKEEPENEFDMLELFGNDEWHFAVIACEWSRTIGGEYFGSTANAQYMKVHVYIKNVSKSPSYVFTDFNLIDEEGNTYDRSEDEFYIGDKAFFLDKLNPGVSKTGILVFDVPKKEGYKLKVTTGFLEEPAFVRLEEMTVSQARKRLEELKQE